MSLRPPRIIKVKFEQYERGWIATSPSMSGLFISHNTLAEVARAVPVAIRLLIKAKDGSDVLVQEARTVEGRHQFNGEAEYTAQYKEAA